MLRPLYRKGRAVARRVLAQITPAPRLVQTIPSELDFFQALDTCIDPIVKQAQEAFQRGDRQCALEKLSEYLHSPDRPQFFIPVKDIAPAIQLVSTEHPGWREKVLREADRVSDGFLDVYALEAVVKTPDDWKSIPLGPGKDILYRERPHRFGFVPRLALASLYGHPRAFATLKRLIQDWVTSVQPDSKSSVFSSTFEASSHVALYRLIAISWALSFLAASDTLDCEFEILLLRILYGESCYIERCLPETTANNHVLADGFGLWYAGTLFPMFQSATEWLRTGERVFCAELNRQLYDDGTSFEQSVHYQEHACEMAVAYLLLSDRNGRGVSPATRSKIKAMLAFQSAITGRDECSFAVGDTTEDSLFPLDGGNGWCGPALSALSLTIFGDETAVCDFRLPSVERAFWLTGGEIKPAKNGRSDQVLSVFPNGGFAVFSNAAQNSRLLFRTGPEERVKLVPGHMHADYLSIYLVVDGRTIIVPSGTYTYRGDPIAWPLPYPGWREYFLSPESSNGLVIDAADQLMRGGGDFPGGIKGSIASRVRTGCGASAGPIHALSAQVTGESEYAGWGRSIVQVGQDYWLVIDMLPPEVAEQSRSMRLQLSPDTHIERLHSQCLKLKSGKAEVLLSCADALVKPSELNGSHFPRGGWVSETYGGLQAAPQLLFPVSSRQDTSVMAIAVSKSEYSALSISQFSRGDSSISFVVCHGKNVDSVKISLASEASVGIGRMEWNRPSEFGETLSTSIDFSSSFTR